MSELNSPKCKTQPEIMELPEVLQTLPAVPDIDPSAPPQELQDRQTDCKSDMQCSKLVVLEAKIHNRCDSFVVIPATFNVLLGKIVR